MKISILTKAFSRVLFTPLALGVALGLTQPGNAATVNKGTDYLLTPSGGGMYNFGGSIGMVSFSGLPIGGASGIADTIVNRLQDVLEPTGVTPIEIVGLSLAAEGSYLGKIFVGLNPSIASTGQMTITHSSPNDVGGIWSSSFTINGMAIIANPDATLTPTGDDYISGLISKCGSPMLNYTCYPFSKGSFTAQNELWTHDPNPFQITGPNLVSTDPTNFYLRKMVLHIAPDSKHIVCPVTQPCVPSPLPILGASTAYGFARRLRKRCREAVKVS